MNWNEWWFRNGLFWLFVLVLVVIIAGCSNKVDVLDPMPIDFGPHHKDTACQLHQILEEPRSPECRNLRLT